MFVSNVNKLVNMFVCNVNKLVNTCNVFVQV
jgi:hypothetical protein